MLNLSVSTTVCIPFGIDFDLFALFCLGLELRAPWFQPHTYKSKIRFLMYRLNDNVTVQAFVYFRYS